MKYVLKHHLHIPLFMALALGATGCTGWMLADTGKDKFVTDQSCPKDQIKVRHVPVQPRDIFETPSPPAEVAADPARLEVWTRTVNRDLDGFEKLTLVDLVGCGLHRDYLCFYETVENDQRSDTCFDMDLDNPRARLGLHRLKPSAGDLLRQRLLAGT